MIDLPRTHNNVDHRAIQQAVRQKHPTIEALIKILKQEQAIATRALAGDVPPFIRRKLYFTLNQHFKTVLTTYNPDPLIFLGVIVQNIRQ